MSNLIAYCLQLDDNAKGEAGLDREKAIEGFLIDIETMTKIGSVRRQALSGVNQSMPWYSSWRALAGGGIAAAALALILTVRMDPLSEPHSND